jgi:hypothetical protein
MDSLEYGLLTEDEEELDMVLDEVMDTIEDLLTEIGRRGQSGIDSSVLISQLDEYIKSFENCDSIIVVTLVIRISSRARMMLRNWMPLLELAKRKWPEEVKKGLFVGLAGIKS